MKEETWPVLSRYNKEHTQAIAMPVGGIGTGFFALGGRGQLTEWQLMSRPNRGWRPPYAHLLLRTQRGTGDKEEIRLRVMEGDSDDNLGADFGAPGTLMGVSRFPHVQFEASYPFGRVRLEDREDVPLLVDIEAFNPLIPKNTLDSSLPLGLLTLTLTNPTTSPVNASVTLLMTNIIGTDGLVSDLKDNVTEYAEVAGWRGMRFYKARDLRTAQNGTMAFLTDAKEVRVARRWPFQGSPWNGEYLGIIDSLLHNGYLPDAEPSAPCPPSPNDTWHSSVTLIFPQIAPNESQTLRLLLTWHFPLRNLQEEGWWSPTQGQDPLQTNWYATQFQDAMDVARKVLPRLEELRAKTISFVKSVVQHPAPHALREAALFNLTPLRTHTCFRLADGTFLGWEGCAGQGGCCIGSCTHVWNYEVATLSLFPDLHRSMLESHLKYGVAQDGGERFRLSLPLINPTWYGAAADGQMGLIVRIYSQYLQDKEQDGEEWLRKVYPTVKRMLAFAWLPGGWDADKDGVMEGAQHNTYDVEFFGPNPLCNGWYLAALEATAHMADVVGDREFAQTCRELRKKGAYWMDNNLYNGQFYQQQIKPPPKAPAPMTAVTGEFHNPHPQFQLGAGCLIDQLVGQYRANRCGLGDLLDRFHILQTLASIFHHNHHQKLRNHYNNMRTFATPAEAGTVICSYPLGGRPERPFPYFGECMTGFEYQFAVLLLDYGLHNEALKVVEAVRNRHDGRKRNPFNEPECGSYYARCMAAWALLEAWEKPPARAN